MKDFLAAVAPATLIFFATLTYRLIRESAKQRHPISCNFHIFLENNFSPPPTPEKKLSLPLSYVLDSNTSIIQRFFTFFLNITFPFLRIFLILFFACRFKLGNFFIENPIFNEKNSPLYAFMRF